jgi:hypothetical protein
MTTSRPPQLRSAQRAVFQSRALRAALSRVVRFARLAGAACAAGCLLLGAAHAQIAPGEYLGENGTGRLVIQAASGGVQKFQLNSYGANGHSCEVEGSIRGNVARVPTEDKQPPCVIKFSAKGENLDVNADGGQCQSFCGARASIGTVFLKPAPGCTTAEVKKTRTAFKQQFDKKDFAQARALLQPVVDKCVKLMNDVDEGWVRNDLALTLLRLNDKPGCLKMLESFKDLAAMDQKALEENYPPFDAQIRAPIARATRTNLKLCGAK